MQQSSKALDRSLSDWFSAIRNGQLMLPRFQRHGAWDQYRISSFLTTVIHNLPVGVALVLEVGEEPKFDSRYIETAENNKGERVNQHLLDGQQRLTAMWRALYNNYEHESYFVHIQEFDKQQEKDEEADLKVYSKGRYKRRDGRRFPLWCDIPEHCLDRGLIPAQLLRPLDIQTEIDQWIRDATAYLEPKETDENAFAKLKAHTEHKEQVKSQITKLRERVAHFNLPYLSLPTTTEKEVALQVFINMNTNSKPLTRYDIIVAEVESATDESLHDMQRKLVEKYPAVERYHDVSFQILATSALLQDKLPNERGMIDMNKSLMIEQWSVMEECLNKMTNFLASQGIHDKQRLPTNAVLGVIAACYRDIPDTGDFRGKAEMLLQRYLWSAFFTDRYENSAASRAHMDYRGLRSLLQKGDFDESHFVDVPVLNRQEYPLAKAEELETVDWPKKQSIRARGILAVANHFGAYDFADNQPVSFGSLQHREYHHLYPDALLKEVEVNSYVALNCALITWKTNRNIGRKDPLRYIEERTGWVDKEVIEQRLNSHLIPYKELANSEYGELDELKKDLVVSDFNQFIKKRAILVADAVSKLANGKRVSVTSIMNID